MILTVWYCIGVLRLRAMASQDWADREEPSPLYAPSGLLPGPCSIVLGGKTGQWWRPQPYKETQVLCCQTCKILSQFAMALNRMSFSMMALGLERSMFPGAEVDALSPAPHTQWAALYMLALGLWHPQENPTMPRPVPTPSCNSCRNCKY